ncbi:MAG: hypothetical protein ACFFD7_09045 [Candidatus Thorarchaeota archaeon]
MPVNIDIDVLNQISKELPGDQLQNIFNQILFDLIEYLELQPIHKEIQIIIIQKSSKEDNSYVLDSFVKRTIKNGHLVIELFEHFKFLPFVLLREAFYCFIPEEIKSNESVKICINQIVENELISLDYYSKWKKFIRDALVDRDFLLAQFDRLKKFFSMEASEPFDDPVRFFFKDIRENATLIGNRNISDFYDLLYESYSYKTSKSLFNNEIVETLRIIKILFDEYKRYLSSTDYNTLLRENLENQKIKTFLSLRKFNENLQWINKYSSIAPSYNRYYNTLNILPIHCSLIFNPFIENYKVKKLLKHFSFFTQPKFTENSFATGISMVFHLPNIYLDDLLKFIKKMEDFRFIVKKQIYVIKNSTNFLNLNYFLDFANTKGIIDPKLRSYSKVNELKHSIEYPTVYNFKNFTIFEIILLDRIRNVSVTGLTFDKRIETVNAIKDDIRNEKRRQRSFIDNFLNTFEKIAKFKKDFVQFLTKNRDLGFYYLYDKLNSINVNLDLIENVLQHDSRITKESQLQTLLNKNIVKNIDDNLIINDKNNQDSILKDLIPLYFKSKASYVEEVEKIRLYYDVLDSCYNLKILNLRSLINLVKNSASVKKIHDEKEKKYKNAFKTEKLSKITGHKIDTALDELLQFKPPIIKPMLVNTIFASTFAKYYPLIILRYSTKTYKKLVKLKSYFPRMFLNELEDVITHDKFIFVLIYLANIKEKALFVSIIYNYFRNDIILYNRYFWRGIERISKLMDFRDFYDFQENQFIYTRDLFDQLLIYAKKIFGDKTLTSFNQQSPPIPKEMLWSTNISMDTLVKEIKLRFSYQNISFKLSDLNELLLFRKNLKDYLLNQSKYLSIKTTDFFTRYIKSIKFIPAFRKFGMAQYYLYIRPDDHIDLKLLLANTFQKVEYSAIIEDFQAIYIKFIFPYKNPNKSYLNWLTKSKKVVRESCLFYKKKIYTNIHFERTLGPSGWNYSSNRFKSHIQNILFNPKHRVEKLNLRIYDLDEISEEMVYGPSSPEFKMLSQTYNRESFDTKTYLGTKKYSIINNITKLIEKNLIFPYISLKNLDFQDKISIILPDIKIGLIEKILNIFGFFNFCRIYKIEGEYYIRGLEDNKVFENGLLIEIWFPKCELDEFFDVFDLLFQYLEINHYLILTDLVNGKTLLKSIFGNLNFLNTYNPIINLKWNNKDKIWMNHKLFNEKFEPIYPDLLHKTENID